MSRDHNWRSKPQIRNPALHLRHMQTHAEALLWQELRNRSSAGLTWRRQHPIGPFPLAAQESPYLSQPRR